MYASLASVYGIGKTKAKCINGFFLNHPAQTIFDRELYYIMNDTLGRNLISKLSLDMKLKLKISKRIRRKLRIFCYPAFRLMQGLPQNGQRTKSNAGTPSHYNPYLTLNVNLKDYPKIVYAYKKRELLHNERFNELKSLSIVDQTAEKQLSKRAKRKKAQQEYIRNMKQTYRR
jgi:ribosomal protein S13